LTLNKIERFETDSLNCVSIFLIRNRLAVQHHHYEDRKNMINFRLFLFLTLCLFMPLSAMGGSSPMVERHIFLPEPDTTGSYKSPLTLKLEKELMFTGVIISSHGKWAMIREKGRKTDREVRGRHKEGDEVKGMVIRKIGNNFLILAGEGTQVRLSLYHEGKQRPAMPAGKGASLTSEDKRPSGSSPASSESRTGAIPDKRKSPFPHESKMPVRRPAEKTGASPPEKNPFQDAVDWGQIKKGPFPPVDAPFPQETPPDPFLQENPNPFLADLPPNPFLKQDPDTGSE